MISLVKVTIRITKYFKKAIKPLLKKYPSLTNDLLLLQAELYSNPKLGTPLGRGVYKIRLKITSKSQGKSGGARVISLLETTIIGMEAADSEDATTVILLSIYDKADVASISDKELKDLISRFHSDD